MVTNIKEKLAKFKEFMWVIAIAIVLGFSLGYTYAYVNIITDCKVLGMTRFGAVPMGCRVGEKYQ